MSYFQDATAAYEGHPFHFSSEEGRALESLLNYWHGPGQPSSWLGVATLQAAQRKMEGAPQSVALELAAQALGTTVKQLRDLIRWHEQYMRWHDGDPGYHVLED